MRKAEQKEKAKDILRRIDEQIVKTRKASQELARESRLSFGGKDSITTTEELKKWKGLELHIIDLETRRNTAWDIITALGIMDSIEIYKYVMQLHKERLEKTGGK